MTRRGLLASDSTDREVKYLKKYSECKHIVNLIKVDDTDRLYVIQTERFGTDMFSVDNTDENTVLKWLIHICKALKYIHSHGELHNDISPENIVVKGNCAKLIDFGSAASKFKNIKVCKPGLMSPERELGKPLTGASDVWSLGMTLINFCYGIDQFERALPKNTRYKAFVKYGLKKVLRRLKPLRVRSMSKLFPLIKRMMSIHASLRITVDEIIEEAGRLHT